MNNQIRRILRIKEVDDATGLAAGDSYWASKSYCDCCSSRRGFLGGVASGLAALGVGALLPAGDSWAQAPNNDRTWIDIHCHYAPPAWVTAVGAGGSHALFGMAHPLFPFKQWTPDKLIEQMDGAGVATACLSITTPGIWFGEKWSPVDATRKLARSCNEYGAKMVADHPGRFGQFAVLPLPDVEGSLHEIEYAMDTLHADGFGLLTHYGEHYGDRLLGDPAFAPVFEELNRRKAIVYVHRKISPEPYEIFGWDIHRTILSLLKPNGTGLDGQTGGAARYPDIRFIFSHAGGTMPFLVARSSAPTGSPGDAAFPKELNALLNQLRRFHYDGGHSNNTLTLSTLSKIIPISQILFGTDYPYTKTLDEVNGLRQCGVFNADQLKLIYRDNAIQLLPRLAAGSRARSRAIGLPIRE